MRLKEKTHYKPDKVNNGVSVNIINYFFLILMKNTNEQANHLLFKFYKPALEGFMI